MKMILTSFTKPLFAAVFLMLFAYAAAAQPGSGGPRPTDPDQEDPVTGVPIDGGASLLLAAGGAYGLKKLNDYRKGRSQEPEA